MEPVRYRPSDVIRWLDSGSDRIRESSSRKAQSVIGRKGARTVTKDIRDVAGALMDAGAAALADLKHRQAESAQYLIADDYFEVITLTGNRKIPYSEVVQIRLRDDDCQIILERGSVNIRPFAHLVSGRVKVPIGWLRNDIEVPFELIIDEIAAHCNKTVIVD